MRSRGITRDCRESESPSTISNKPSWEYIGERFRASVGIAIRLVNWFRDCHQVWCGERAGFPAMWDPRSTMRVNRHRRSLVLECRSFLCTSLLPSNMNILVGFIIALFLPGLSHDASLRAVP